MSGLFKTNVRVRVRVRVTVVKNQIKNTVLYCIVDLQVISFSYKIESSGH